MNVVSGMFSSLPIERSVVAACGKKDSPQLYTGEWTHFFKYPGSPEYSTRPTYAQHGVFSAVSPHECAPEVVGITRALSKRLSTVRSTEAAASSFTR